MKHYRVSKWITMIILLKCTAQKKKIIITFSKMTSHNTSRWDFQLVCLIESLEVQQTFFFLNGSHKNILITALYRTCFSRPNNRVSTVEYIRK